MFFRRSTLLVLTTLATASFLNLVSSKMSDAECDAYVLKANRDASIGAFDDSQACLNDKTSVGCFANTCRFCRWQTNEQSRHFVHCDASTRLLESMKTEAEVYCPALVSAGDLAVGITAYFDSGCPTTKGGLGCQENKCRLCKTRSTPQSAAYEDCPLTSTDTDTTCSNAVKNSGLTSVDFVSQASCNTANPQAVGCVVKTKCRLCRNEKNEGNQYLVSCKVLRDTQSIEITAAASTDGSDTLTVTTESETVDESHEIMDATEAIKEGSHEILAVSTTGTGSLEIITAPLSISAAQEANSGADVLDNAPWIAVGGTVVLVAVVAVLAIRKSRRSRLDSMKTPRTPTDPTALMSVHTCIATL